MATTILQANGNPITTTAVFSSAPFASVPHSGIVTFALQGSGSGTISATVQFTAVVNGVPDTSSIQSMTVTDAATVQTLTLQTGCHNFVTKISAITGTVQALTLTAEGA